MSAEYVDNTLIGDGGSEPVVLDLPIQEAQPADDADAGASQDHSQAQAQEDQQHAAQGEQVEQPDAEAAAAAAAKTEEAQAAEIEAKTPEEKASYWRGQHFKSQQESTARIAELEQQIFEANATPAFIKLDKPPGEWNPAEQLKEMPSAYADKLLSHGFWYTLPTVIENIDNQPENVQAAIFDTMNRVFQKQTGHTFEDMVNRLAGPPAAPTQTNQPQSDLIQKLEAEGYTDADPAMQAAKWAAAQEGRLRQLEAAHTNATKQQETFAQQQQVERQAQAERAFATKKTEVWDNALKTFEGKVPKASLLRTIRNDAKAIVDENPQAKAQLDKIKGFMMAATTPAEREQYERLAAGSLITYNAIVGREVQRVAKEILDDQAEKEQLRTAVNQHQLTRRDIGPGQTGAPSGTREEILKRSIGGDADIAAEMAVAMFKARRAS